MIPADEAPCFAGQFGDQRCAAMLTGVVESADLALQIAHHQYGRSCVAGEEPAAGVRDLIDMAGVEPGALPHAFTLQLQELGIGVADAGYIGQLGEILGRSEEHTSELQSLMRISYA